MHVVVAVGKAPGAAVGGCFGGGGLGFTVVVVAIRGEVKFDKI